MSSWRQGKFSDLKGKVEKISVLEKDFVEKLRFFEEKINDYQLELRNRARLIYELRERLEAEKLNTKFQPKLEEISISTELKVIAVNLSFY
jgi:ribosomal protein S12 methylthiotransferase accessory factor YcaO